MDEEADEARIRARAYELWEAAGGPEGRAVEHWDAAQAELGRPSQAAPPPRTSEGAAPEADPADAVESAGG